METVGDFLTVFNFEVSRSSVTFSLCFMFLALLYWYSVYPFSVLSRCGIKHPKPLPFFGNLLMFRKGFLKPLSEMIKTHGKVCGYYLGRKAVVVIADLDMLRQVLVKDFSNFPNRMGHYTTKPLRDSLVMLRNEQWRRVRSILTPSFSAAKLKEMIPLINTATDALMNNLNVHSESEKAFDIHKCFGSFILDVSASVAFGIQLDSQKNPDDPFLQHANVLPTLTPFMVYPLLIPTFMAPFALLIPDKKRAEMQKFLSNYFHNIIKQRELPPDQRPRDFLQLMLDAQTSQDCVLVEHHDDTTKLSDGFDQRNHQTNQSTSKQDNIHPYPEETVMSRPQRKTITEDEILSQSFIFLLAGFETTSSMLAFTCYLLALHPECQQKIQEEVDEVLKKHDLPSYTNVQELKYLDMVICESLRLYPPGFKFERDVEHDCVVNGQFLLKGMTVQIPVDLLHHDPEYWPDPEKFIPERFTPEANANRHPFVYLPFGAGPRNCVGMKLAQLEIRMALVHLFHRFNIVACSETKVPLDLNSHRSLFPKHGVFVKITRRDKKEGQNYSPEN